MVAFYEWADDVKATVTDTTSGLEGHAMVELIARLRKSKEQHESDESARGKVAGKHWAQGHAEYGELLRLEQNAGFLMDPKGRTPGHGLYEDFMFCIDPYDKHPNWRAFWSPFTRDDFPSDAFLKTFIPSALGAFRKVKKLLTASAAPVPKTE
jgi:hypothetical protein